jgi:DNA segregation ATPase FtsK/SpoIIIE-like protein
MPKITINLKTKTLKAVQNYAKETNQLLDKVVEEAIDCFMDPGYEQNFDEILLKAKEIAIKYDRPTASLLQRDLKVGYARAQRILDYLEE